MSAMDDEDLWPADITSPPVDKPPLAVLKAQAAALAKKTGNLLEAEVNTRPDIDGGLVLRFTLVAPALSDYRYDLFTAVQSAALYPVKLLFDDGTYIADSEEALKKHLRHFFASEQARKIVSGLIAQSRA